MSQRLKCHLLDYYLKHQIPLPGFLEELGVNLVYSFAENKYIYTAKLTGDVLLLRATAGDGVDQPFRQIYSDLLLGWSEHITGSVKVLDLPGGHSSMLQEPNVAQMREQLQDYLNQFQFSR